MTLPPAEQPKPPEAATPEEIIVPKNIIRPFARGLFQMATEPLDQIRSLISSLPTGLSQQEQEQVDEIKSAPQSIISTLEALRTAREVKVSVKSDQHYEIEYSEEKEEEEIPREGQILVDKSTAHPLVIATFDRLGNYCARLMYAELLHSRGTSEELREKMGLIDSEAKKLGSIWSPLSSIEASADAQLKISTDGEGNTTIEPIQSPITPSTP